MRALFVTALIVAGFAIPASANEPVEPSTGEYWSPGQSLAGAFARTSVTREEQLQRAVAYIERVCSSDRLRARRECARVWGIIDAARAEAQAGQAAQR